MSDPSRKKILRDPDVQGGVDSNYHITSLRVPLFEIDLGQALYHGNYYHLFELGREDMLRNLGFPYREFMNRQLHLAVVEARCKYRKPVRYDDQLEVHTAITVLGARSLSFSQFLYRPLQASGNDQPRGPGRELCTECRMDMVCVQFTGRPSLLPEDFRRAVEPMLKKG